MGVNGLLASFLTRAAAVRHAQSARTRQSTAKDIGHAELYPFPNTVLALNVFAQNPSLLESGFKKSEVHAPTAFPIETVQQPMPGWNDNCDYLRLHFNRLRACNDKMDDDRIQSRNGDLICAILEHCRKCAQLPPLTGK